MSLDLARLSNLFRIGVGFLCLMLMGSCAKRDRLTDQERLSIRISRARLLDVTVPLNIQPVVKYVGDDSFGFLSDQSIDDLLTYYLGGMEALGWQLLGKFDSVEKQLVFLKPHKMVIVTIREHDSSSLVLILTTDK